jgi:hypothetical protein
MNCKGLTDKGTLLKSARGHTRLCIHASLRFLVMLLWKASKDCIHLAISLGSARSGERCVGQKPVVSTLTSRSAGSGACKQSCLSLPYEQGFPAYHMQFLLKPSHRYLPCVNHLDMLPKGEMTGNYCTSVHQMVLAARCSRASSRCSAVCTLPCVRQ